MLGLQLYAGSIRCRFSAATVISTLCPESQGWNGDSVAAAAYIACGQQQPGLCKLVI